MSHPNIDALIVSKSRRRKGTRPDRSSPRTDACSKKGKLKGYQGPTLISGEIPLETWLYTYKIGGQNDRTTETL